MSVALTLGQGEKGIAAAAAADDDDGNDDDDWMYLTICALFDNRLLLMCIHRL